jgi:hypothetical protein
MSTLRTGTAEHGTFVALTKSRAAADRSLAGADPQPAAAPDRQAVLDAVRARVSYLRAATEAPADDGWIACASLCAGEPQLYEIIAATGEGRGAHEAQVAASLFTQAYAFRVGGVALAAYALGLPPPSTAPATTAILLARHRPSSIAHLDPVLRAGTADQLVADLLDDHLRPFVEAVRRQITVGERLLWGNVATSCAVAFRAVEGESGADAPAVRARAAAFFAAAGERLESLGGFVTLHGRQRDGWFWERTNCCLWYQASGGQLCDDCSLHDPADRRAAWQREVDGDAGEGS